jgi:hypothetical protein
MKKTVCRVAIVALAATVLLAVNASSASASPTGAGWFGSWQYSSASKLLVNLGVPGALLSSTGTDNGANRTFSVTLQDTNGVDGLCAWMSWSDGTLNTTTTECGGEKTFTPSDADGDVAATLCLSVPSTGALLHCNNIDVPSTHNAPYIRAAGWGFVWQYVWSEGSEFAANLYLGGVGQDSIEGYDNDPQTNQRLLVPYVGAHNAGLNCVSMTLSQASPALSDVNCSDDTDSPASSVGLNPFDTAFTGCYWSQLTIIGAPDPHYCISGFVPVPN